MVDDREDPNEVEAARRRDEVVKRMLATPPQPKTAPKKKRASCGEDAPDAKPET